MVSHVALLLLAFGGLACASTRRGADVAPVGVGAIRPLAEGEDGFALRCGKLFTLNDADEVFAPGLVVVREGRIDYAGPRVELPAGYDVIDAPELWAAPGMIDLHSHIQTGGWGDINDMVLSMNPEYRTSPTIVPGNRDVQRACSAGVTTLFGIPGSGTNNSGFGVLYKTRCGGEYERCVLRDPGGMKVAQAYNPERRVDLGATRSGMAWNIAQALEMAIAANEQGRRHDGLTNLQRVVIGDLPVLIHTAGSDAVHTTIEMWGERYPDTRPVLSHGCFDGWKVAPYAARVGIPVNLGPRTFDWRQSEGEWVGTPERYAKAGANLITLNTDAPVMPQEELFLQGAMGARYGADPYLMLKGCTVNPAKSFGIDDKVGSLQPGRHADIVLWRGDPLDPRARVESVWIEGTLEYDRARDCQRF
ncbi:MAG: amidohydrolase family protein [Planctomycetes bacterium]|nr:amidohydrolase family protein [Planctomycetota bacterium]